jgi:hypothetical protein
MHGFRSWFPGLPQNVPRLANVEHQVYFCPTLCNQKALTGAKGVWVILGKFSAFTQGAIFCSLDDQIVLWS